MEWEGFVMKQFQRKLAENEPFPGSSSNVVSASSPPTTAELDHDPMDHCNTVGEEDSDV